MKTTRQQLRLWLVLGAGLLGLQTPPLCAQQVPETGADGAAVHAQQLAAERNALLDMLNDPNTPAEKKAVIQSLQEWNTRGLSIAEVKRMQAQPPDAAHTRKLATEQQSLRAMLNDPALGAEEKVTVQQLLAFNRRGLTIAEVQQTRPQLPDEPVAAPAPPVNNLAEAEAAPLPANVNVGGGAMLQSFSKGRDAEASARSSSSLGLVKAQQEMDNATRESEAKVRDALNIRNQAGATALAQRQQDAASAASQQAAGSMGNVLGDSLVQSVQQGAQAAGQAIGGGAAGRMGGAIGQTASGGGAAAGGGGGEVAGGAAAAGASAAAGQIFGGSAPSAPAAVGGGQSGAGEPAANPAPATIGFEANAMGDVSEKRMVGKRYVGPEPWQGQGAGASDRRIAQPQGGRGTVTCFRCKNQFRCNICANPNPNVMAKHAHVCSHCERPRAPVVGLFDAACPKHGKYGGEIGKVKGCPKCEQERYMMWDAVCPQHGAYGGQGPVTGCPKCAKLLPRPGSGYIR